MKKNNFVQSNDAIIIYQSADGRPSIEVRVENETVWLSQAKIVELFTTSKANVSEHIKHIFEEGELERNLVVRKFRTTAVDDIALCHREDGRGKEKKFFDDEE